MTFPAIIIVDDDPMVVEMVGIVLRLNFPHTVVGVHTPHEALDLLKERSDVVLLITDFMMPDMNGATLIRELRKFSPELPVILLTGYFDMPELLEKPLDWTCLQKIRTVSTCFTFSRCL